MLEPGLVYGLTYVNTEEASIALFSVWYIYCLWWLYLLYNSELSFSFFYKFLGNVLTFTLACSSKFRLQLATPHFLPPLLDVSLHDNYQKKS